MKQAADLTGELDQSKAQNVTNKSLSEGSGVCTELALYKTASQQRVSNYVNECEGLSAERFFLDMAFQKYRTDLDSKVSRLQAPLEREMKSADEETMEREKPFVVGKGPKGQLRYEHDDSKELQYLQYKLDAAIAKERRAQYTVMSLERRLSSVRNIVEGYRQRLPEYTERFIVGIIDNFGGFLYDFLKKAQPLTKKQRADNKLTVTISSEAVDGFLCNIDTILSQAGPSSQ